MAPLSSCDVRNFQSVGRNKSQHTFRSVGQADRARSSANESGGTKSNRLTFAEDFMLEHSNASLRVALFEITASAGSTSREPQHSAQHFGFPS
jgi:hypothetical protein